MIEIRITGWNCEFTSALPKEVHKRITDLCKHFVEGAEQTDKYKDDLWDGYDKLFRYGRFPIGLLDRVEIALQLLGQRYRTVDTRPIVDLIPLATMVPLRDYQIPIVRSALERGHGLIQAPTGSGKTVMMMHILAGLNVPSLIVVPTIDLIDQTIEKMEEVVGIQGNIVSSKVFKNDDSWQEWASSVVPYQIGKPGSQNGNTGPPAQWWVSTWQTISAAVRGFTGNKYKVERRRLSTFLNTFHAFCFDEVHYLGARSVYKVAKRIPARYRFGFSATPYRTDGAELKMNAAVGEISSGVTPSELIRKGYLVRPNIEFCPTPNYDGYLDGNWQDVYRAFIVENHDRNKFLARKALELSDEGRIVLVMVTQIKHGEIFKRFLPDAPFINGQITKKKRALLTSQFRKGEIPIIISSSVWNVGVDFPVVSGGVMAGPYKTHIVNRQRLGRFLRPDPDSGKEDCKIIETMDPAPYLGDWSKARFQTYKEESEYNVYMEGA